MSKLKTVNDMGDGEADDYVLKTELKTEAVKWYNGHNTLDDNDWIEFFNLTEEDLA